MSLVECNKCGWVHFPVSLEYAINWEKQWKEFYKRLDEQGRISYGVEKQPPTISDSYLNCFKCNNDYKDFKDSTKDVTGHTIQPILDRNEIYESNT